MRALTGRDITLDCLLTSGWVPLAMLTAYFTDRSQQFAIPDGQPHRDKLVWVDLLNATPEEVAVTEASLAISIPSLASLNEIEKSSRMRWDGDAIVVSVPLPMPSTGGTQLAPVGIVLRGDVLVTVRTDALQIFEQFVAGFERGTPTDITPASIATGLLEVMVDTLADRLEEIGSVLDGLATDVFRAEAPASNGRSVTKIDSVSLRILLRRIGALGQVLGKLRASLLTTGRVVPFLQTEAKSWLQEGAANRLATARGDLTSLDEYEGHLSNKVQFLLDAALGLINMDQNDSFKVLTVVSVVGIPPTLIASIYGMNFHYMPELGWPWGYVYGLALIVLSAVIPLVWFKIKGWF